MATNLSTSTLNQDNPTLLMREKECDNKPRDESMLDSDFSSRQGVDDIGDGAMNLDTTEAYIHQVDGTSSPSRQPAGKQGPTSQDQTEDSRCLPCAGSRLAVADAAVSPVPAQIAGGSKPSPSDRDGLNGEGRKLKPEEGGNGCENQSLDTNDGQCHSRLPSLPQVTDYGNFGTRRSNINASTSEQHPSSNNNAALNRGLQTMGSSIYPVWPSMSDWHTLSTQHIAARDAFDTEYRPFDDSRQPWAGGLRLSSNPTTSNIYTDSRAHLAAARDHLRAQNAAL